MGLKKRSLSLVGRGKSCTDRYKKSGARRLRVRAPAKKGLGFFGHVTEQASGWCETRSDGGVRAITIKM
jgi:hypothetical protein